MELISLPAKQRNYTYSQSMQISMQTGLIGHLRADMGSNGYSFFSTWTDFRKDLKTEEFKAEFDIVINELRLCERYGGILASRFEMEKYCHSHPESCFEGNYTREYGFRVNTENYAYLLRLNPHKGDYNLYCYCYRRDWLDQHLRSAERGIRFITSRYENKFWVADEDKIRVISKDGDERNYTVRYIDDYHLELDGANGNNLYHICELAELFERNEVQSIVPLRASLPESCYSTLDSECAVVILKKGEEGYYSSGIEVNSVEEAQSVANNLNEKRGITKAQEKAMKAGSMFGFAVPTADPACYELNGNPAMLRHRDRAEAR